MALATVSFSGLPSDPMTWTSVGGGVVVVVVDPVVEVAALALLPTTSPSLDEGDDEPSAVPVESTFTPHAATANTSTAARKAGRRVRVRLGKGELLLQGTDGIVHSTTPRPESDGGLSPAGRRSAMLGRWPSIPPAPSHASTRGGT